MSLLRRRMMMAMQEESWTYILLPNSDGKIPSFIISLKQGQHVYIEYLAHYKGTNAYKGFVFLHLTSPNPIINQIPMSNEAKIYEQNAIMEFDMGGDGDIVFSGSVGSTHGNVHNNRHVLGDYIKIRIT